MSFGDYKSMQKEPGGPADAPGHVGMSVSEIESENERLREKLALLPADWTEDASLETWFPLTAETLLTTQKERDAARLAVEATLLFHSGSPWGYDKKQRWQEIALAVCGRPTERNAYGQEILLHDATTKTLCDIQRAALSK